MINELYSSVTDWIAVLPSIEGLDFWTTSQGGTQMTAVDAAGNLINQPFSGNGTFDDDQVWVSEDPTYAANNSSPPSITLTLSNGLDSRGTSTDDAGPASPAEDVPIQAKVSLVAFTQAIETKKEVFAFEGMGGYPVGWPQGNDYPPQPGVHVSPPQVLDYWRQAAKAAGPDVAWHYYTETTMIGVWAAEKQIQGHRQDPARRALRYNHNSRLQQRGSRSLRRCYMAQGATHHGRFGDHLRSGSKGLESLHAPLEHRRVDCRSRASRTSRSGTTSTNSPIRTACEFSIYLISQVAFRQIFHPQVRREQTQTR